MFQLISPVDGSLYHERPAGTLDEARAAIAKARKAQAEWVRVPIAERAAMVRRAIEHLRTVDDDVVTELAWMMGRPVQYGGEVGDVEERAFYMADIAEEALKPIEIEMSNARHRMIKRMPFGVVLVIAPWNYPYLTAVNTIVPALIAGNAVFLKHSEQTMLAGDRFADGMKAAGLPEGLFINMMLEHDTIGTLIQERAFGFVNFTGSVAGGQAVERVAAGTFTSIGLELGGKDAAYVMEDFDVDAKAEEMITGAMFNNGQCCCSIERLYIAAPVYDRVLEKIVSVVEGLKLGNPLDPETSIGPMAHRRFADAVRKQVAEAIEQGATPMIDPALFPEDDGGTYLAPQILTNVTNDMPFMRDESFGPVVGVMKVESDEEAIALINDSDYGLAASLWTNDMTRAEGIADQLEVGTVWMNKVEYLDPALCWTGCKNTGRGGALSVIGYQSVTRPKSYHLSMA
ncbi:aldehyde dehydrogenase family protein [Cucumibacter marinus]|uniref:aldehyde dehydrogenase family protein n=1 Tax=Cucumibacter marinus TaxID=1121252 RepID=UPI000413A333|nr:aldehyde dehydrogenase family protein [Cucumibacter marinus]